MRKDKVIREIQKRYKKRKHLNISAVKREAPELLEAAYTQEPFWGWKQAIDDAGIDYATINVEIRDYVVCQICGKDMKAIGGLHFEHVHNTSAGEYLEEFPGAEVRSEAMRCFNSPKKLILPHWEPFATPEYVLDRAMAIHRAGHPLNQREILLNEPTLIHNAMKYFGNWDAVLRRIGLNINDIRRHAENGKYTKAYVKAELRRIFEETGDASKVSLIESGHSTLWQRSIRLYGSFAAALKAAGIRADKFCQLTRYEKDYDTFIKRALKLKRLYGRERRDLSREIRKEGRRFVNSRFNSNWSRFAKEHGIPISRLDRRGYPTRRDAKHELLRRQKEGLPIDQIALIRDDCPLHVAVVKFWSNYTRLQQAMRRWR